MDIIIYASTDGRVCLASVSLGINQPIITLLVPNESFCVLFSLPKIGKEEIFFDIERIMTKSLPPTIQAQFSPDYQDLYRVYLVRT